MTLAGADLHTREQSVATLCHTTGELQELKMILAVHPPRPRPAQRPRPCPCTRATGVTRVWSC